GIDHGTKPPTSECIEDCVSQYQDSLKAETKLHKKNLQVCNGGGGGHGDGGDNDDDGAFIDPLGVLHGGGADRHHPPTNPCAVAQNKRDRDGIKRIAEGRQGCIGTCHHQGGGSGH